MSLQSLAAYRRSGECEPGRRSPGGGQVALWAALDSTALQPAVLAPAGLAATLNGSQAGEPAWIGAMDRVLTGAVAGLGTQAAIVLAALCTVAAMAVAHLRLARLGVAAAALAGTLIWVAEDFGGILTGQATDPNTGLLLIVAAVAFWPLPPAPPTAARAGPRRP